MEFILLFAAILLIIFALSYFAFFRRNSKSKKIAEKNSSRAALVNCPICGSPLLKGQNIISKVYRPMNVPDQRCTVSGCQNCFPICKAGVKRICPVCAKSIPQDGYLVSRLFNRTQGKKHVMIVGCNQCLHNEVK